MRRMTPDELQLLRTLLQREPVAALATLHKGDPAVSMVPFAMWPERQVLLLHVSSLSPHTQDMQRHPSVSLLVTGQEAETPLALPRVSITGQASTIEPESADHAKARSVYLAKLPDAEPLFGFGDFSLVAIAPTSFRFVAGFGRAMALVGERMAPVWQA